MSILHRLARQRVATAVAGTLCHALAAVVLTLTGVASAQGMPSGDYGQIPIGGSVQGTIAAAASQAFTYHTYTVQVPTDSGPVRIQVNGMGADLDLAVKVGSPITDYDDVDHLDTSEDPNPAHTVGNAAGKVIYVDVLNLVQQATDYTVTVGAAGANPQTAPPTTSMPNTGGFAAPIGPNGEAMPSGEYGPIAVGSTVDGALEAAGEFAAFHTFWIDVPQAMTDLTIAIDGLGSDLDVALQVGAPITDYEDADYLDTSDDPDPVVVVEGVVAERIYVDVLNLLRQPARYRMTVSATTNAPPESPLAPPAPHTHANPMTGDPLLGSFEGDGLQVVVRGGRDAYDGELVLNGQRLPFRASGGDGRLDGTFSSGGQAFAFAATLTGDTLVVESGGAAYRTQRTPSGAPTPANPLGPGGSGMPTAPANDPILAEAPYGTLTQDNALAFFEALVFAHEQLGFPVAMSEAELDEYVSLVAQAYPTLTGDEQLALSMSREIWTRVQANWARAATHDQQEFVIGVLSMWYGEQQIAQWMGSGSGGGAGGGACADIDACFSQYASPEAYEDATNAQSCWAAAGCSDYDSSSNEFTYEDDSYDSY